MLNKPLQLINSSLTPVLIFDEGVAAFSRANWRSGYLCCLLETFKLCYSLSAALCVVRCMIRCRITMQPKGCISLSWLVLSVVPLLFCLKIFSCSFLRRDYLRFYFYYLTRSRFPRLTGKNDYSEVVIDFPCLISLFCEQWDRISLQWGG